MPKEVGIKLTQSQYDNVSHDLVLDLTAVFKVMEDDIKDLTKKAIKENWTPERLITEIEAII